MQYIEIPKVLFRGKQNIPWDDVEQYLRKYDGLSVANKSYGDVIRFNAVFADEYSHSTYTKKLRGGLAKVKANLTQILPEIVENAQNRRWVENKDVAHNDDAKGGWYRYDTLFAMRVQNPEEEMPNLNYYRATLVARINDMGIFLYDVINIKKEARRPTDS